MGGQGSFRARVGKSSARRPSFLPSSDSLSHPFIVVAQLPPQLLSYHLLTPLLASADASRPALSHATFLPLASTAGRVHRNKWRIGSKLYHNSRRQILPVISSRVG